MNKKELNKITKVLEYKEFSVFSNSIQGNDNVMEFGQYTPLGEDWTEVIFYDGTYSDFKNKLIERAENFNVDEEVEPWIENRGKNGIPSSIKDLIKDAEWKQKQLKKLSKSL